jgi:hypothetical protein
MGKSRVVTFIPLCLAKLVAPAFERRSLRKRKRPYFTPYAISVLGSGCQFSSASAADAFGYDPRPISSSIRDTVLWLKDVMVK